MAPESVQVLPGCQHEQLYELVSTPREQQGLVIIAEALTTLLTQLFECIHSRLAGKLMLQEIRSHQFTTTLPLYNQNSFDDIIMSKVP